MSDAIEIRRVQLADLAAIAPRSEGMIRAHAKTRADWFGAYDGARVVASAAMLHTHGRARLIGLYVEPSHRLRGIAEMLIDARIDHALRCGLRVIETNVSRKSGHGAYLRRGFSVIGNRGRVPVLRKVFRDDDGDSL